MSDAFVITGLGGRQSLAGELAVGGAKNAALKALAASLLFKKELTVRNVPNIEDIYRMVELLRSLGLMVTHKGSSYTIEVPHRVETSFSKEISQQLRASIVATGPMLARFGRVSFPHPGGCVIGARPIDLFIDGYKAMGARVRLRNHRYEIRAPRGGLRGATIFFKNKSVGATETFMMAGVLAKGTTVLKNAACEPEIEDVAKYLVQCGATITGAGTHTITIKGGSLLTQQGGGYKTLPDRLEAGSFLILGALAAKELTITHCNPAHLESLITTLQGAGVAIETTKNTIIVRGGTGYTATDIKTHEYPGFPTDLQAPMAVFLTQATGQSLIFETIFEGRLLYTEQLASMGANISMCDPHRAIVGGPTPLRGRALESPDIRAGLAFIIAAIIAEGASTLHTIYKVDRGYEAIEERLRTIGVSIERVEIC